MCVYTKFSVKMKGPALCAELKCGKGGMLLLAIFVTLQLRPYCIGENLILASTHIGIP